MSYMNLLNLSYWAKEGVWNHPASQWPMGAKQEPAEELAEEPAEEPAKAS